MKKILTRPLQCRLLCAGLFCLAAHNFQFSTFAQGSLTPPGAPAPTMKTLAQIEPRTPVTSLPFAISSSGSFYLTTNLTGAAASSGITITADNVTLDLNGFSLIGVPGSLNGITLSGTRQNIVIRNGLIREWGVDGIDGLGTRGAHYLNLHLVLNGRGGLSGSFASVVKSCSAVTNVQWGIAVNTGSTVSDCTARNNGGDGFTISNDGSIIRGCASSDNTGSGFFGSGGNLFVECAAARNRAHGFNGGGNNFRNCSATANGTNGFTGSFALVEECHASNNTGDGIAFGGSCSIRGNHCYNNGFGGDGAGIHTTSSGNRIEGNSVVSNDRGIQVDSNRSIIFGNTAVGNTINYVIAGTNQVGVIVLSPTNNVAISGSSGGVGLGTTDPWANFSH